MNGFMIAPTQKQIDFVEAICDCLGIEDFPSYSRQFTKSNYSKFISAHIVEFYAEINTNKLDEDDLYDMCENDVWTEFY